MWVFAAKLPEEHLLIAPRGLYPAARGGYAWHPMPEQRGWPRVDDFLPSVGELLDLLGSWPKSPAADFAELRLAGFSQGAALAYTFTLLHSQRVRALAGLSGFLPEGAEAYLQGESLQGLPVYISHGTKDELVPVDLARQAVQRFQQAGARVTYCESEVGHKLSADCFRGMETFFED
jgi:phospholipase/carboxylesterase